MTAPKGPLGVTNPKQAEQAAVLVKEPLAVLRAALRTYVLRVLAEDADVASTDSAEALLAPLTAWDVPPRGGKPAGAPDGAAPDAIASGA